jgi:hypothetical protein
MTDFDVMSRVSADLKRAVITVAPRGPDYRTAYAVSVEGVDAVRLMVRVRAELGASRQRQVDAALEGWASDRERWSYVGLICAAEGCALPAKIKGLCKSHFTRWYKATTRGRTTTITPRPQSREDVLADPAPHACSVDDDLAWLAGLLEGEGCFSTTRADGHAYPVISLKMVSPDVVERAARQLNTTNVHQVVPRNASWNITVRAAVTGAAAALWMQRLRPLMGSRRQGAIDAALATYYPIRLTEVPESCCVPGCEEPPRGRGLCHKHYMSWSRDRARGRTPRVRPLRSN